MVRICVSIVRAVIVEATQIGECFAGDGVDAAHVNTVLGRRGGPVEVAWATALATPRPGHAAFVAVLQPNLPVQPMTLFVNKATIAGERHGELTWGAAQAGVAAGVADAVAAGIVPEADALDLLLIAAVWVNPDARDADAVFANNRRATADALANGATRRPAVADVLEQRHEPFNPYYTPPSS
jgi:5,6,7,8-tetrahydromethanopterin hydro-lyase